VNHNLEIRLQKLEMRHLPSPFKPQNRVIGSAEECEARRQEMVAAGLARDSDDFIFRIIVSPGAT